MAYLNADNESIVYFLMLPVMYILYHFENQQDKKLRSKVMGKIKMSSEGVNIKTDSKQNFTEI